MSKIISAAALVGLLLFTIEGLRANAAPPMNQDAGTVVIAFKDGHKQSIPASTIQSMQFKSASGAVTPISIPATPATAAPGRLNFVGKWSVGDGNGGSFYITLEENGTATKSTGAAHGTWTYVNGEAHVAWDEGWHDAIRKVGSKYEKFAFAPGKSFSDAPSNVTEARNTNPQPI